MWATSTWIASPPSHSNAPAVEVDFLYLIVELGDFREDCDSCILASLLVPRSSVLNAQIRDLGRSLRRRHQNNFRFKRGARREERGERSEETTNKRLEMHPVTDTDNPTCRSLWWGGGGVLQGRPACLGLGGVRHLCGVQGTYRHDIINMVVMWHFNTAKHRHRVPFWGGGIFIFTGQFEN